MFHAIVSFKIRLRSLNDLATYLIALVHSLIKKRYICINEM